MSRSQKLQQDVLEYLENNRPRFLSAIRELAQIPAPSGQEELRAQWCKQYLESLGATGVYIDEALNVIFPYGDMNGDLCAILGHTDVVFQTRLLFLLKRKTEDTMLRESGTTPPMPLLSWKWQAWQSNWD